MLHCQDAQIPCRADALGAKVRKFSTDESGSLVVFGLMMFVIMLIVGGLAVDVMNFEARRVRVQDTLDTSVLAAANLNQSLSPSSVVSDYFQIAGLSSSLGTITADKTQTSSIVTAAANVDVPTLFMRMLGFPALKTAAAATAQETIGSVEISLVLDNSGSMAQNSKIQNLRIAAQQFVNQMFSTVDPGKLTISLIGYSAQSNIGPAMMAQLNATSQQTTASCIDFTTADFLSTTLPAGTLNRTSQFDPWDGSSYLPNANGSSEYYHTCPTDTVSYRRDLFFQTDQNTLDTAINAMQATDNTSIDLGVKWGAVALDPSMQPVVSNLISSGYTTSAATGRPAAYSDHDTAKVMVVMTDGENTARPTINAPYITGNSLLWYNASTNSYSLYDANMGATPYWSSYQNAWLAEPYGNNPASGCTTTTKHGRTTTKCAYPADAGYPNGATNWTWPQVWNVFPVQTFLDAIVARAYGYSTYAYSNADTTMSYWDSSMNAWLNAIETQQTEEQMDANLHNICAAAKAKGIIVYSIGFMTTSHGASVLTDCATAPSYYFNVTSSPNIADAFSAIATNINQLRLTL